jgi:hypothetical protein
MANDDDDGGGGGGDGDEEEEEEGDSGSRPGHMEIGVAGGCGGIVVGDGLEGVGREWGLLLSVGADAAATAVYCAITFSATSVMR